MIVDQFVKNSCSGTMASGEGSPRASKEVTINALLAAIMSVKHDLSGRMERIEERMDGMEGSFSRRMDTLERLQRTRNDNLDFLNWDELKALMRERYVMERYKQEQLTKLYNLRQGDRSVEEYYGEFQNLILRLDIVEPLNHCLTRFKGGLYYEVVSQLVVHKFDQIKDLIEAAIEVERNNHTKKTFGWDKSYKPLEKKPFDKTIQSEFPNRRNIILVEGDPYFVGDKVTKNDVSEGTPQKDDGNDGEPERVVEEEKVNVPCGLMRRTSHDDAWPEEGERPPPACCDEIRKQDPKCLCEYLKNPAYQQYVNRANVEKALRDCAIPMPNC
ncbi:hypothetical protein BC332_10721 [Capsicum chinense]|nr:hypothetical protein BC332_10721 [Capsicum chinense]